MKFFMRLVLYIFIVGALRLHGAMIFDGMTDSITVKNSFIKGLNGITVSVWVKGVRPGNILVGSVIFHYQNGYGFYLRSSDKKTSGYLSWETTVASCKQWQLLTATWSNEKTGDGRMRLYVNGVKELSELKYAGGKSGTLAGGWLTVGGVFNRWISGFKGEMEDLRIYDRALSSNEVFTIYAQRGKDKIDNGLILRWPMISRGNGTEVADVSGNGNTGTMKKVQEFSITGMAQDKQLEKTIAHTLNEIDLYKVNCAKIIAGLDDMFSQNPAIKSACLSEFTKLKEEYRNAQKEKIYSLREIYKALLKLEAEAGLEIIFKKSNSSQ